MTLVLKRFSFIGDGLSHVAFGAMSVATACCEQGIEFETTDEYKYPDLTQLKAGIR